ncbi:hypothetical protein HY771_03140 [Candidatus Uhrbacteria bacterium]|nr:hypothetical protein [Candidatus Uhrbacteria bacterium]
MIFQFGNPWMFERDEIDLLEEEIDDIYLQHEPSGRSSVLKMETRVLQEQFEIETEAEAELAMKIGPAYLLMEIMPETQKQPEQKESLKEILRAHAVRDPLYEHVFLWSRHVSDFARESYENLVEQKEDAFRAYVNVKMIPIKLVGVHSGFSRQDSVARQIAQKDRHLCLTYFAITLRSLQNFALVGNETAMILFKEGEILQKLVKNERI